jgi:hypothetical protein
MNASFRKYAETLEKIEVLTVTITPEGEYNVPSEKKGKIAQIDDDERVRLREYLFEFACRMECGDLEDEERERLRKMLQDFCGTLECPNPAHAAIAGAAPKKARSA